MPPLAAPSRRQLRRDMKSTKLKHLEQPSRQKPVESIQALRAVAAAMVVIYHIVHMEQVYGGGASVLGGPANFGFAGVDIFFVISGFIMAAVTAGRFGDAAGAWKFLCRRAIRIFPLYWLCTAVVVAALLVRPALLDPDLAEKSVMASLLLLPQEGGPLLVVGWTLTYELFFYTVTALALACSSNSRVPLLVLGWAVVLLVLQMLPTHNPSSNLLTSPLAFEFMAGALSGLYWRKLPARHALLTVMGAGAWMVAAGVLLVDHAHYGQADAVRVVAFGLPAAFLVAGLARLEIDGRIRPPRFAVSLGDASYSLYLTHLFVLSLSGRIWSTAGATGTLLGNAVFVVSTFCVCCGVALLVYRFAERPLIALGNHALTRRRTEGARANP